MIQSGTKNYINTVVESGQLVGIYLSVLSFVVLFLQKLGSRVLEEALLETNWEKLFKNNLGEENHTLLYAFARK